MKSESQLSQWYWLKVIGLRETSQIIWVTKNRASHVIGLELPAIMDFYD